MMTSTMLSTRRASRGFTLIEILLSMLFLSLGIMGVIAFFFLGATDSREAVRMTRTTMIAKEVREGLVHALRYPLHLESVQTPVYRFELPTVRRSAQGEAAPLEIVELPSYQTDYEPNDINGFYFYIDDATSRLPSAMGGVALQDFFDVRDYTGVLDLPIQGSHTPLGAPMGEVFTWEYRDGFKPASFPNLSPFNEDDSHMYSFRILIRRGPSTTGERTGMFEAGDMLCVTVYVFRQFNPGAVNTPGFSWDMVDPQTGQARYSTPGGPIQGIQPLATYHFYIGAS